MANFDVYSRFLSSWEGGYVHDAADPGGETMRGVTLRVWNDYCKRKGVTCGLRGMTDVHWREIMKEGYWDKVGGDGIRSQCVAMMVADWAVNAGWRTAAKGMQRCAGVDVDGIVGKMTLAAVNGGNEAVLFRALRAARLEYYRELARKKVAMRKFLNGWENRTSSIRLRSMVLNDKGKTEVWFG